MAQWRVQANGFIGYTLVDEAGFAGSEPNSWEKTMSGFDFRGLYQITEKLAAGLEYGYTYLMWYEITLPFAESTIYRGRDIDATKVMVFGQYNLPKQWFSELGWGGYFFEDFTNLAVFVGIGYNIPVLENLYIPVKIRGDWILDSDASLLPLGLNAGVEYRL